MNTSTSAQNKKQRVETPNETSQEHSTVSELDKMIQNTAVLSIKLWMPQQTRIRPGGSTTQFIVRRLTKRALPTIYEEDMDNYFQELINQYGLNDEDDEN